MGTNTFNNKAIASKAGKLSTRSKAVITKNSQNDLARIADYGIKSAKKWLDRVGEENPGRALALTIQLLEYVHPKLSRRESVNLNTSIELTIEEKQKIYDSIAEDIRRTVINSTETTLSE